MPSSRSGAGGKIVANRRKDRLAATPYDRPPPAPPAPPKSPNWFAGIIVPSARAIVSGAGRIFSSIFSESESSSSEDEDSASEDAVDNDNQYENLNHGVEGNMTSSEMMQYGQESQLTVRRPETKKLIEQLIMQETFSREECDKLIQVINSRVIGRSMEDWEKISLGKTTDLEDVETFNKAVQEAKKWFQEKKVGSSSVTEFAHGTSKLRSHGLDEMDSGGGSPVDVARSYMKDRPPWASPTRNFELRSPFTSTMKLFNEGTQYSGGPDSLSSSKKRSSLASGSWNIQEELRRVRSKAIDDLLRTPPSKIDQSLFAVPQSKEETVGGGKAVFALGEQIPEPESLRKTIAISELIDAGVSYDPALAALESRQDGKATELQSSGQPAASVHGNDEVPEAVRVDGECAASESPHRLSSKNNEEHQTDSHLEKSNGPPTGEAIESSVKQTANGVSSLQASVPAGAATSAPHMDENYEHHDAESHDGDTTIEKKPTDANQAEGDCELLSEAYLEVPIVTETDSIASGSQNSLGMQQHDETPPDPPQEKNSLKGWPQGRKPARYNPRKQRKR